MISGDSRRLAPVPGLQVDSSAARPVKRGVLLQGAAFTESHDVYLERGVTFHVSCCERRRATQAASSDARATAGDAKCCTNATGVRP